MTQPYSRICPWCNGSGNDPVSGGCKPCGGRGRLYFLPLPEHPQPEGKHS
jgi:DnaJ-class molecular chaperone